VDGLDANGNPTIAFDENSVARNYWQYNPDAGIYEPSLRDGGSVSAGLNNELYSLFALPGNRLTRYTKRDRTQFRLTANATTQVGVHQLEFGGEFEQRSERLYDIVGGEFARYFADGNPEAVSAEDAVTSYEELPFDPFETAVVERYGYNYLGTEEVDEGDIDAFDAGENYDLAPYEPIYYAGYLRDKIEFRDIILDLGVRVDVFDNNTQILTDPFAFRPIVRAGAVTAPDNIEDDYAVYFEAGPESPIVGYRDIGGNFYDADGDQATREEINRLGSPSQTDAPPSTAFEDYEPQVTFQPRIGVSFPVTDRALFFASYNVLNQRPTERAYLSPAAHLDIRGGSAFDNPALEPERTVQYELGFRQRIGARAALQISGFYRTQKNKIGRRTLNASFPAPGYYGHFNVDFTTTRGATFEFDLRRTRGIAINANYTLSFAQGTGSDAATAATIAWRGTYFPDFISPAGFDRRHSVNASVDYRLGAGEGPMVGGTHILENFGVNVLAVIQSGRPYTQLQTPVVTPIFNQTNNFVEGSINGARYPWSNRIDLRVDRRFQLGGSASLTAFVWVQNLLDERNVFGLFRGTGLPTDDGFLTGGGADNAISAATDPDSYTFHYDYYTDNPNGVGQASFSGTSAFGLPRRTRVGVRVNF
jgi:outer membrane receptor protein involved in Fe transport